MKSTYVAANYSMGTAKEKIRFRAHDYTEAKQIAEREMPKANAGPGTAGGPTKTRVIGLRRVS